jgi:hypothetical protein
MPSCCQDDLQCIKADPEDGYELTGSYTPDVFDIHVSHMLGFNSGSMSLKVGWGSTARHMGNISYDQIDIVNNQARIGGMGNIIGFDIEITHSNAPVLISNFSFSNIRYDEQAIQLVIPHGYAKIRGVSFTNVSGEKGNFSSIGLNGASDEWNIANVAFNNVRVGGELVTEKALSGGMVAKHAENITFS